MCICAFLITRNIKSKYLCLLLSTSRFPRHATPKISRFMFTLHRGNYPLHYCQLKFPFHTKDVSYYSYEFLQEESKKGSIIRCLWRTGTTLALGNGSSILPLIKPYRLSFNQMLDSLGDVLYAAEGSLFSEMLTGRRDGWDVFFGGDTGVSRRHPGQRTRYVLHQSIHSCFYTKLQFKHSLTYVPCSYDCPPCNGNRAVTFYGH